MPRAVKALLVKGARVNVKEKAHDQTALMWAAAQRHPEVTELLIEAGAEINAQSLHVRADRGGRADAAVRPRRAELHRASRRQYAAAVRGAVGRHRVGAAAACGRRERQRRTARWHQRAGARRAQRSWRDRGDAAREGRESRTPPTTVIRRSMPRCCEAIWSSSRRCSRTRRIRTCARPKARRCAATRQISICRRRSSARRRICLPRAFSSRRS